MRKAYVQDGDVGCGTPGSLSWHKCSVAEMNQDERLVYFREALLDMTTDDAFSFMAFLIKEALQDGNGH